MEYIDDEEFIDLLVFRKRKKIFIVMVIIFSVLILITILLCLTIKEPNPKNPFPIQENIDFSNSIEEYYPYLKIK